MTKRQKLWVAAGCAFCLGWVSGALAQQGHAAAPAKAGGVTAKSPSLFGRNLLVNGNAEAAAEGKSVPGWGEPQEGFSSPAYGSQGGEWDWGLSGCPACGKQYFHLMWEGEGGERSFSQTVDVSMAATDIDGGKVQARLSGYLGGYRDSDTSDRLVAFFQDAAGKELGSLTTAYVDTKALPAPTTGSTSLMLVEAKGTVPAGTRRIRVSLQAKATGTSGSYLALADDLSLLLQPGQ